MPNKAGFPFENTRNKLLERSKAFRKAKTLLFATVAPHMKLHRLVKFSSKFRLRILRHAQNFNRTNSIWFSLLLVRFRSLFLAQSSKNSTDKETQGRPDWRVNKKHATEVQKRQGTMVKNITYLHSGHASGQFGWNLLYFFQVGWIFYVSERQKSFLLSNLPQTEQEAGRSLHLPASKFPV